MGGLFKYLAWLVAGIVTLFVLAAVALYLFFDPNDFREDISAAVEKRTGRELLIEGDISLDLFPWLAVAVGKTSLGDAPGFGDTPIAQFDRATFSVRLMPVILRQEIIVGGATIDALQLNLKIDTHGASNWADLIPDDSDGNDEGVSEASADLDINRIDINDATITYSNAESGEVYEIDSMNLHIGRLRDDGAAVPLDGNTHFSLQPTGLTGDLDFETVLSFNAATGVVELADTTADGSIEGVASIATEMHFSTDNIAVDTRASTIAMQPVDLTMLAMRIRAKVEPFSYEGQIAPTAQIAIDEFSPQSVMALFDVEPPKTNDPDALSRMVVDATAQLTTAAIELTSVRIKLDDTTFNGTLSVPRSATGAYQFDLSGDTIDLNRYMEPAADPGGDAVGESAAVEIPTELIESLNARGKLTVTTATLANIEFENAALGLNASGGRMRLYPVSADLFGGAYQGDVRIDASGKVPTLSVNEKIEGVNLADLAKAMYEQDNVTGTIGGSFVLSGKGEDLAAIQHSLAGTMSFELLNGTYEGMDIWYELRRARAKLRDEEPPQPQLPAKTSFSTVRASGVVANGVLKNDDLFAELPHMQITGAGTVNLAAATVDYGLVARILERPEFLSEATPEELDEFTEAVIPLKITGPLASPSVRPDVEKLLRQRVEEEIKDRLEDKLKDLFKR